MTAIPEQITATLVTRLALITTTNGYFTNVASVDRVPPNAAEWTPNNLSIAVVNAGDVVNEQLSFEGNPPAIAHDLTLNIHAFVRPSDDDTNTAETTTNAMVEAIREAVTKPAQWHNFGGVAIDARLLDATHFSPADGDHNGATVPLIVTYRISETDPTQVRA